MAREAGEPLFGGLEAREAVTALARVLADAGVEGAARDARLLVLAALGLSATDLMREPERPIASEEAMRLAEFAKRRAAREPVSRILGERGFYGRTFHITPATLDPRPCTETVVEAALEVVEREGWRDRPIRILDVGTGSGALLVTLLAELPLAIGLGTDISDAALDVARANAERLGVGARASFQVRRSLEGVEGTFDLVVSNPPYIPSADIRGLDADVRDYDPLGALDGGEDGLAIYRELAAGLLRAMPEGWVLLEVGAGQASDVEEIFREILGMDALAETRTWQDLGKHTRCVAAKTQR